MIIDAYYDIQCQFCGKNRSDDFCKGFETDKNKLTRLAHDEGWTFNDGKNLCPECSKVVKNPAWIPVTKKSPPCAIDGTGINTKTEKKYWIITNKGEIVFGYIYRNRYTTTGYAVYDDESNLYVGNVTHWDPYGKYSYND